MKLLALLTPVAMLGALWVLQRLEVWMSHPLAPSGRGSGGVARDTAPRSQQRGRRRSDHA